LGAILIARPCAVLKILCLTVNLSARVDDIKSPRDPESNNARTVSPLSFAMITTAFSYYTRITFTGGGDSWNARAGSA
jgi:hypothetical protein